MILLARVSGVSFHLPDLDTSFPKLVGELEKLQQTILLHDEGPPVEQAFQATCLLALQTFRREEEAMHLCRDKSEAMHKLAHRKFLANLTKARSRFQAEGPSVGLAQDLRVELVDWLVDHHQLMNAALGRVIHDMVERSIRHHQETDVTFSSASRSA